MNCIQTYVQTQSLGTIIAPVNGSWIQAYAEYIGLVTPINDSWLQAICEEFGITEPLYGSWTIALANYYGITQPRGTWWCALADAPYTPPGGTPPFQWDLDTRAWEVETRTWNQGAAGTNLLDTYQGASVALSLRHLRTDYTEAAIRVRYSSLFEEDIFFDGNGELDTATLLASAATNGGDAFVKTWYDQSGNGNNATQSSNGNQYKIVTGNVLNLENGKPAADNRGKIGMSLKNIINTTGSLFVAGNQLNVATLNYIGGAVGNNGNWFTQNSLNGQAFLGIYQNASNPSTYATPANQFIANWNYDSTWNVSLNNGVYANTTGNLSVNVEYVWGRNLGGLNFDGNCQEWILWPTSQATNLNGISTNMNDYYSAYGPWTPASFSNVQNWWTADLGVTEAGGSVSAWSDQINSFSMQQPTAAKEPTLTTSATLNNEKVISFNGIDQYLYTATPTASWTDDLTMLSVMNLIDVKTGGTLMGAVRIGAGDRWWVDTLNGDLRTFAVGIVQAPGGGAFLYENPAVTGAKAIKQRYDGSTGQGTYAINTLTESNSTSGAIGTTTMTSTASVALGATLNDTSGSVFGGRYVQVEVAEQVWIHGTPTATEMNEWKTYVNTKYGTIIV